MKRFFGMLLAVVMVLSLIPASVMSVYATDAFDTENFKGLVLTTTVSGLSVKLFKGNTDNAPQMTPVYTEGNDQYFEVEAGGKYYYIAKPASGSSRYNIRKNIYITEEEAATKTVLDVTPHTRTTAGWDTWAQIIAYSDETMAAAYPSDPALWPAYDWAFTTPVFTNPRNPNQQTSQTEMMDYINGLDGSDDNMYTFTLGKSGGSKASEIFDIPVVFFSTTDLSGATTWEEAAALLRDNGKLTFMYQALIHGLEPGGGEAALSMLKAFDGSYGEELLPNMNICVIPRLNPYGVYMTYRQVYANGTRIDPNRDFLKLESIEAQLRTQLYNALEPEVCYDAHECNLHPEYDVISLRDVWLSTNFTPKATDAYRDMALDVSYNIFDKAKENDLHYGWYASSINGYSGNISSTNISMRGSLIFLNESMGIAGGMQQMERRIMSHVTTVTGVLDYVNENTDAVQKVVDDQRADIVNRGRTYEESDIIVMESGYTMHPEHYINGKQVDTCSGEISDTVLQGKIYDVVKSSRVAPTAYVIPAGESWTDDVLSKLDIHGIAYTFLPAGAQVNLQQYGGTTTTATLSDEGTVTFPKGAYVMTMAQEDAYILALLMEPDVKDVEDYTGTFAQQGLITATDGKFPIYRYIHDLNEEDFINYTVVEIPTNAVTVYWNPVSGADTNDGLTEATPVKTVEAAYAALSGADAGTLVMLDTLTLTGETTFPSCDIPVTITSKTGSEGIKSSKNLLFAGDTTLENLTVAINAASNATFISAEGHNLTIGENVITPGYKSGSTNYYFCITGSFYADNVDGMHMTVKSGTWRNIYAAAYKEAVTGDVMLTVTGGKVPNNIAPTYSGAVTGNVEMFISGVNAQTNICGTPAGSSAVISGNVTVTLGEGVSAGNIKVTKQASGKVTGKVSLIVEGDLSKVKNIIHGSSSGGAGSTELILRSGKLACNPCSFDKVTVDVPAGKTLTLEGCSVSATTAKTAGTLAFGSIATLAADSITGSLNCAMADAVVANHTYVSAPAGSSVLFPESTGITENQGLWGLWGEFDDGNFTGLVLRTKADVELTLYTGLKDGTAVIPNFLTRSETENIYYYQNLSGYYRYIASGEGYYTITKNIYMTEAKNAVRTEVDATPGKMAGTGWEVDYATHYTDEAAQLTMELTPQMREKYADVFTTPIFTSEHAEHQMTTQSQMEEFLQGLDGTEDDMYIYSVGKSQKNRDIPIVFFTRTDLSGATTLDEAAALMGQDKPTILYRAQVHGNEPSACEGALAVILRLDGAYGESVLDKVNVCVIPRVNPDGAYNYDRRLQNNVDGNRDNLRLTTPEITAFMHAYQVLMPELVLDGHEYNANAQRNYLTPGDILVSVSSTPVNSLRYQELSYDLMFNAFDTMTENGMDYRYYSNYMNGSDANVMCSFMGRQGTLAMLLEIRGIDYGLNHYERRVLAHVVGAESAITYVADNAGKVQQVVDSERQRIIREGSIYNEEDPVILDVESSTHPEYNIDQVWTYQDGTQVHNTLTPSASDVVARSRIAPTAYVIAAQESYTQTVLSLMDKHDIAYEFLPAGTTVLLRQYTGTATEAGLTEEKPVTFENGAYVFYKNQVRGITLSMLMEPDVTDLATYKGTLAQRGILPVESIYRYCHDLNEQGQLDHHTVVYLSQSAGSDANDGLTEATPVATVAAAYAKLQQLVPQGGAGAVILLDTYAIPGDSIDFPACDFKVLLTSKTGAEGFAYAPTTGTQKDRYIAINSETTFENITITYQKTSLSCIKARGHKLTIGACVNTVGTAGKYLNIVGGSYEEGLQVESTDVTVRSGHWRNMYASSFNDHNGGDVKLTVQNCIVDTNIHTGYSRNIYGNSYLSFENVTIAGGIYGGNGSKNTVYGDVTIRLGENVSVATGVYAGSRTAGDVTGTVTVIADGADLSSLAIYGTAANATGKVGGAVLALARDVSCDVTVDPNFLLDLCGHDITGNVTVDGTLTVKDSATDDYDVSDGLCGEITGTVTGTLAAADGYVAAAKGFHKFDQYISGVSLRPSNAGIYYTATVLADEVLRSEFASQGVAVSLVDLPGVDFETDEDTLYTVGSTGVMIQNILKGDTEDADRGITDIYAASYVKLKDGTVLVSDENVAYSLYDVLLLIRAQNADALTDFLTKWNIQSWFN